MIGVSLVTPNAFVKNGSHQPHAPTVSTAQQPQAIEDPETKSSRAEHEKKTQTCEQHDEHTRTSVERDSVVRRCEKKSTATRHGAGRSSPENKCTEATRRRSVATTHLLPLFTAQQGKGRNGRQHSPKNKTAERPTTRQAVPNVDSGTIFSVFSGGSCGGAIARRVFGGSVRVAGGHCAQEQRQSAAHGETVAILGREQESGLHARMPRVRRGRVLHDFSVRQEDGWLEPEEETETLETKVFWNGVEGVPGYPDGEP